MFIKYDNKLYDFLDKQEYFKIITRKESKADETYYKKMYVFVKEITPSDSKIEDIYEVDFYVMYVDTSDTLKNAEKYVYEGANIFESTRRAVEENIWCVNEGRPLYRVPELEKNELGLNLCQISCSDDWKMDDRGSCSKIVDLYECSDYTVVYTYTYKDGQPLAEKEVVEVKMDAEAFKAEMLKYRRENI